ncbi:uncharacterized protein LOC109715574 [Ananas comosus]|uniref:Uncharacterized protein LOC109715574 n=1 Tax=Ananas comosus TaxID=4615 RepID=A0A6P5FJZ1_ANACO|nr:uncharacterized protein LOC109715574 [Ananas comosus]
MNHGEKKLLMKKLLMKIKKMDNTLDKNPNQYMEKQSSLYEFTNQEFESSSTNLVKAISCGEELVHSNNESFPFNMPNISSLPVTSAEAVTYLPTGYSVEDEPKVGMTFISEEEACMPAGRL